MKPPFRSLDDCRSQRSVDTRRPASTATMKNSRRSRKRAKYASAASLSAAHATTETTVGSEVRTRTDRAEGSLLVQVPPKRVRIVEDGVETPALLWIEFLAKRFFRRHRNGLSDGYSATTLRSTACLRSILSTRTASLM